MSENWSIEHLASLAVEINMNVQCESEDIQHREQQKGPESQHDPTNKNHAKERKRSKSKRHHHSTKRHGDPMYLESELEIQLEDILPPKPQSYLFPRDEQSNYICLFQGCPKPIRSSSARDYHSHLRWHSNKQDKLLSNMLRAAPNNNHNEDKDIDMSMEVDHEPDLMQGTSSDSEQERKRSKKRKSMARKEWISATSKHGSPNAAAITTAIAMTGSDGYSIPTKPSSRGIQLREQMLRYGLHLFRMDSEGKYICFFRNCSLHMITNFSRHIAKHEKVGDSIKPELLHLCNFAKDIQTSSYYPLLHPLPSSSTPASSFSSSVPMQMILQSPPSQSPSPFSSSPSSRSPSPPSSPQKHSSSLPSPTPSSTPITPTLYAGMSDVFSSSNHISSINNNHNDHQNHLNHQDCGMKKQNDVAEIQWVFRTPAN